MTGKREAVVFPEHLLKPPVFFDQWEEYPDASHRVQIEQWLTPLRGLVERLSLSASSQDIEEAQKYIGRIREYLVENHIGEEEYRNEEFEGDLAEGLREYLRQAEKYSMEVVKRLS